MSKPYKVVLTRLVGEYDTSVKAHVVANAMMLRSTDKVVVLRRKNEGSGPGEAVARGVEVKKPREGAKARGKVAKEEPRESPRVGGGKPPRAKGVRASRHNYTRG